MSRWRPLRPDESPVSGIGAGGRSGSGEIVCPEFDTLAFYEMVHVDGLGRIAKQGSHVLVRYEIATQWCECACGLKFQKDEARWRALAQ